MLLSINIFVAKATGKKVKTDLLRLLMTRILTGDGVHSRNMEAKLNYRAKNSLLSFVIIVRVTKFDSWDSGLHGP